MTAFAVDNDAASVPGRPTGLSLGDRDLVRRLRARDGAMPAKPPVHAADGRCKYAAQYPEGGCPWCLGRKLRHESPRRAMLAMWSRQEPV